VVRCYTNAADRLQDLIASQLQQELGHLQPRAIVIKPNWVIHETDSAFPIAALVTDARVIAATARACATLFPEAQSITVGDSPLQSADWPLLCRQSGLEPLIEQLTREFRGRIAFRDLRREVFQRDRDSFLTPSDASHGDPAGYREVCLNAESHLEPISDQAHKFAVNDYSAAVTRSNHVAGDHRYLVSQTILDCDLFINLPKWKTHQKSGLTAALKNPVGINGDKAYLPHFRRGAPRWGGDEYADEHRWLYWAQTTLREKLQKRHRLAFAALRPGWNAIKKLRGLETRMTERESAPRRFYGAGGAWFGNQTLWRMVYDLNLVLQRGNREGRLLSKPARRYFCIVDGLTCGEANGPLQPLPRQIDWLILGDDPFAIDTCLGWFMGFDPARMPLLAERHAYLGPDWGDFELGDLVVEIDDRPVRLTQSGIDFRFAPPPGWRGHIERATGHDAHGPAPRA
jgi:uncharacterized protein (DUF362 family)